MADLEFTYRRGMCSLGMKEYCAQCHSAAADDIGCRLYDDGITYEHIIPFGDCAHATYTYIQKGVSTKNYQVEPVRDDYTDDEWAEVKIGSKIYECVKVKIDGEVVFQ